MLNMSPYLRRLLVVLVLCLQPCLSWALLDDGWLFPLEGSSFGVSTNPSPNSTFNNDPRIIHGVLVRVEGSEQMTRADFYVADQKVGSTYDHVRTPSGTKVFLGKLFFNTVGSRQLVAKLTDDFSVDTLNGPTIHVSSPGPLPAVQSVPVEGIQSSAVILRGSYDNFACNVSSLYFEYGTSTQYGSVSSELEKIDTFSRPILVGRQVWGLQPETEYHYRLVVSTPAGTVHGPDATFTTTANLPPVPRPDVGVLKNDGTSIVEPMWNDLDDNKEPYPAPNPLKLVSFSQGAAGLVEMSVTGPPRLRYTAGPDFEGTDTFTYVVEDPFGAQATGIVEIRDISAHYEAISGGYVAPLDSGGSAAGSISLQVTRTGAFTGSLNYHGAAHPFSGAFRRVEEGYFECSSRDVSIPVTGGPAFRFGFSLMYDKDNIPIIVGGSISGPYFDILSAPQLMPPAEAAEEAGLFTAVLPNPNAESLANTDTQPQGHAFATMRVSKSGRTTAVGRLGDNSAFSTGGRLRRDKNVYLNAAAGSTRRARLTGLVEFDHGKSVGGSGTLMWKNPTSPRGIYHDAFNLTLKAKGERFIPPAARKPVFESGGGTPAMVSVVLRERVGGTSFSGTLPLGPGNRLDSGRNPASRLLIVVNPRNGLFSGTFAESGERTKRVMGVVQTGSRSGMGTAGSAGGDAPIELEVTP